MIFRENILSHSIRLFQIDEANQYMKDFKAKLSSIPPPKDYHLVINAKEQKTVSADVQAVLAETISLYSKYTI